MTALPHPPETVDDVVIGDLIANPYPVFDRVRELGSAVWVDCANVHLVTRFEDVQAVERDADLFASTNPGSLMNAVMGHSLMRKDFAEHRRERQAIEPVFRPGNVKAQMAGRFQGLVDELIDSFAAQSTTDLFGAFAEPLAARALTWMLGFDEEVWPQMAAWSQALMDGVGNYHGDADIARRAQDASDGIDAAIEDALSQGGTGPDGSIIAAMITADDPHTRDQLRANVKVIVGGGLNEPRDSVLTLLLGLLQNPDQLRAAQDDPKMMKAAFEEALRWVSPIGMYPRRVTRDGVLGDTELPAGTQIGICVGAANRDSRQFEDPHRFNIHRARNRHLAFGAGPHFCAGAWVARQMVGEIAVPQLLNRLPNLRLDPDRPPREAGWVFRGPVTLPVLWDAA